VDVGCECASPRVVVVVSRRQAGIVRKITLGGGRERGTDGERGRERERAEIRELDTTTPFGFFSLSHSLLIPYTSKIVTWGTVCMCVCVCVCVCVSLSRPSLIERERFFFLLLLFVAPCFTRDGGKST
jgi:hypothetical protein